MAGLGPKLHALWAAGKLDLEYYKRTGAIREPVKSDKSGYIYLIRNQDLYKIGITKNIDQRMRQLKPSAIIATAKSQEPRKIERELHQRFSSVRIPQTEYFRLSKTQVESAKIAINSSRNNTYRKQAPIILPPATNQGKKSAYQKQIATPLPPAPNPEPTSATSLTNTHTGNNKDSNNPSYRIQRKPSARKLALWLAFTLLTCIIAVNNKIAGLFAFAIALALQILQSYSSVNKNSKPINDGWSFEKTNTKPGECPIRNLNNPPE